MLDSHHHLLELPPLHHESLLPSIVAPLANASVATAMLNDYEQASQSRK
jgi:hypothetical protein